MKKLGALQFVWTLVKRTRRIPFPQRVFLVGAGIVIYSAFYVSRKEDKKKS